MDRNTRIRLKIPVSLYESVRGSLSLKENGEMYVIWAQEEGSDIKEKISVVPKSKLNTALANVQARFEDNPVTIGFTREDKFSEYGLDETSLRENEEQYIVFMVKPDGEKETVRTVNSKKEAETAINNLWSRYSDSGEDIWFGYKKKSNAKLDEEMVNPRDTALSILETLRENGIDDNEILLYILKNTMNSSEALEHMEWAYKEFMGEEYGENDMYMETEIKKGAILKNIEVPVKGGSTRKSDVKVVSIDDKKGEAIVRTSEGGEAIMKISDLLKSKISEAKKKPSAGLTKKEKSAVVKKAEAGKDLGKKGKGFEKVAKKAEKEYGSKEIGKKVAAAAMWKAQAAKKK